MFSLTLARIARSSADRGLEAADMPTATADAGADAVLMLSWCCADAVVMLC